MSTQSFPEKDNIIQWCQDDNIPCNDLSARNPRFSWCLEVGNPAIVIYKQSHLPDRIYFQFTISLAQQHVELLANNQNKRSETVLKMQSLITQYDAHLNINNNNQTQINGFSINKIHFHTTIKKADFLTLLLRTQLIFNNFLNHLNLELGVSTQLQQAESSTSSENPLAG